MPERDYPAALRVRCGHAVYDAMVGETVASLLPWDRLGPAAKERYIRAGVRAGKVADHVRLTPGGVMGVRQEVAMALRKWVLRSTPAPGT